MLPRIFGSKTIYLRSYGAASISTSGIVLGKLAAGNGGRQIKVWRRACSAGL